MVNDAVAHALRIDAYIERYGLETVEHLMDIGFALDRHIDFHKGLTRRPLPAQTGGGKGTAGAALDGLYPTGPSGHPTPLRRAVAAAPRMRPVMVSHHLWQAGGMAARCTTYY